MANDGRLASEVLTRRAALGLTQREAAELAGVNEFTWANIEKGRRPRATTLSGIDKALRWKPGSAHSVLSGGDPAPADEQPSRDDLRWTEFMRNEVSDPARQAELIGRAGTWPAGAPSAGQPVVTDQMVEGWLAGTLARPTYHVAARVGDALGNRVAALTAAGYRELDTSDPERPVVEIKARDDDDWTIVLVIPRSQDPAVTEADIAAAKEAAEAAAQATFEAVLGARKNDQQEP